MKTINQELNQTILLYQKKVADKNEEIYELQKDLKSKEKEIKQLKEKKVELPKEHLMSIIIISKDEKIHYSLICKNTDIFNNIENILYKEYPEYTESENSFFVNGEKINRYKNMSFNNIKNGDIIVLKKK